MDEDVEPVSEVVARQEDEPGQRVEDFVLRIRGDRLARREEAVPERELAVEDDLAKDLFRRVVVPRQIAQVEVLLADDDVAECDRGQQYERSDGQDVVAPVAALLWGWLGRREFRFRGL